jgi:predicted nucleic acid-binding protein
MHADRLRSAMILLPELESCEMIGKIDTTATTRIYLDTNVFIEAFEGRGPLSEKLASFLVAVENQNCQRLVTSELTLAELLVKPIELQRHDLIQTYDNWTISNPYLEVVPVSRDVLGDAALRRARDKSLKLPDAIHLATAIRAGCGYFLTNDTRIKGQYGVEILYLTQENVEILLEMPR